MRLIHWLIKIWWIMFGPLCPGSITIGLITLKHLIQGNMFFLAPEAALNSVVLHALLTASWHQRYLTGAFLVIASCLASYAMRDRRLHHIAVCGLLLPQQFLLCVTAIGAISSITSGHYADGYVPDGGSWFILGDQILVTLIAPFYTVALVARANARLTGEDYWEEWRSGALTRRS